MLWRFACVRKRLMVMTYGCNDCRWWADTVFYFLMAATAFLAASSRSSAAVMGRPLSFRILLASWTLVPDRHRRKQTEQTKTIKKRLNNVDADLPSVLMLKTSLCERQSYSGGINPHRQMDGVMGQWWHSQLLIRKQLWLWATVERATCVCVFVFACKLLMQGGQR